MARTAPIEPSLEEGARFREFLLESGYNDENLRFLIKAGPSVRSRNLPLLRRRTAEPTLLNALARLFVLGVDVPLAEARAVLPDWAIELCERCKLRPVRATFSYVSPSHGLYSPLSTLTVQSSSSR